MRGRGMLVRRGFEVAGDRAGSGGYGKGMRWVLMLIVVLAAVMGGEVRAVLSDRVGNGEVVEKIEKMQAAEKAAAALRVARREALLEADEKERLADAGPLASWFPGGLAVARSGLWDGAEWPLLKGKGTPNKSAPSAVCAIGTALKIV